jgi:outer membrane protein TolC
MTPTRIPTAVLPLLLLAVAPPALPDPLSRAEAVARALEANPDVGRSLDDLARFEGLKKQAVADALPEVTAYGSWLRFRDPAILNSGSFDNVPPEFLDLLRPIPVTLWDGSVSVRQTLFNFKVGAAIKGARFALAAGHQDVRRARQAVALAAARAYDSYLLRLEQVKVGERIVGQKESQLEMSRNRRAAGAATEVEVLRFEVDLANAKADLLRLQGAVDLARSRLNAVMVRPMDEPIEPTDRLEFHPVQADLDDIVRRALAERPEMESIRLNVRAYEQAVRITAADAKPSLEFSAAYGYSVRDHTDFFDPDFAKWNAGITLKVPVFDGMRTAGRVAQARATVSHLEHDEVALENQIRLEAQDAHDALRVAQSVYEAAVLTVRQAEKVLTMTEANYRFGAATTLDVLDAQTALVAAETNRTEALWAHSVARATLRYVMGLPPLDDGPILTPSPPAPELPPSPAPSGDAPVSISPGRMEGPRLAP